MSKLRAELLTTDMAAGDNRNAISMAEKDEGSVALSSMSDPRQEIPKGIWQFLAANVPLA